MTRKPWVSVAGVVCLCIAASIGAEQPALYRQANAPVERRIDDLLLRMTIEEKARQLDMYSGAPSIVDKHTDDTHVASDAVFLPEKARSLWGDLGVGSIHDL